MVLYASRIDLDSCAAAAYQAVAREFYYDQFGKGAAPRRSPRSGEPLVLHHCQDSVLKTVIAVR
jgi:hypothetical protein